MAHAIRDFVSPERIDPENNTYPTKAHALSAILAS